MHAARYLTLAWPGLPWAWLRGSLSGLVLAVAFAIVLDAAIVTTFIWPGLVELPLVLGAWTATAVVWLAGTLSAAAAFPPPLPARRTAEVDGLFVAARDRYLARDFLAAEMRLRELLELFPTDGEAQLLLGTLFRRTGRPAEARDALERLARSDVGARWRAATTAELARIDAAARTDVAARPRSADRVAGDVSDGPVSSRAAA